MKASQNHVDSAVADLSSRSDPPGAEYDPMLALDGIQEAAQPVLKKTKRSPKRMANRAFEVEMPVMPPETTGSAEAGARKIRE